MAKFDEKFSKVQNDIKSTPGLGKSMAKWGALGAVVAIPVPFVGPVSARRRVPVTPISRQRRRPECAAPLRP
jgi:hypothetical protein